MTAPNTPPRFRTAPSTPTGIGDLTIADLLELVDSRKVTILDPSSKVVVRHDSSDRYVAAVTTENGRLVFTTSTVDMWRNDGERKELVERIIEQDRTIRHLRIALHVLAEEGEEGAGELIAGLHAQIADLQLQVQALRKKGAA